MHTHNSKKKIILLKISAFFIVTIITIGFAEALLRTFVYVKSKRYPTQTTTLDKTYGWVPKKNFSFEGEVPDATGEMHLLNYTTDTAGFKAYGKKQPRSGKKKVFYLGDSFTQAIEVSNNKTYYSILEEKQYLESFVYGCRGYSTLQEFMVLDRYFDEIQPDLVLLQFCYNDFINNSVALERESIYNNNRRLRPYYVNGNIQKAYPATIPLRWLNDNSMFFQLVFTSIEKIKNSSKHKKGLSAEARIAEEDQDYPLFQEAVATTKQLLQKFKSRLANKSQFAIFYVGNHQDHFHLALQSICRELDILLINSVSQQLEEAQNQKKNIFAKDHAHWNEMGHQITAETLEKALFSVPSIQNKLTSSFSE